MAGILVPLPPTVGVRHNKKLNRQQLITPGAQACLICSTFI